MKVPAFKKKKKLKIIYLFILFYCAAIDVDTNVSAQTGFLTPSGIKALSSSNLIHVVVSYGHFKMISLFTILICITDNVNEMNLFYFS